MEKGKSFGNISLTLALAFLVLCFVLSAVFIAIFYSFGAERTRDSLKNQGHLDAINYSANLSQVLRTQGVEKAQEAVESYGAHRLIDKIVVFDDRQRVILSTSREEIGHLLMYSDFGRQLEGALARMYGGEQTEPILNEKLGVYEIWLPIRYRTAFTNETGAFLLCLNYREVLRGFHRSVIRMALVIIGTSLGLSLLMFLYIYNTISQPLRKLSVTSNELASGNLRARSGLKSKDEIGILAAALNTMAEKLEEDRRKLKESEELYRDLYENAPDMYLSLDTDGYIISCNETGARLLGYEKEELIGRHISAIMTEQSYEEFKISFDVLKALGEMLAEQSFKKRNGEIVICSVNATAIYDADRNFLYSRSTLRDITRRKHAEGQLLRRTRELQAMNEILSAIVQSLDLERTLEAALDKTLKVLQVEAGNIQLFDEDGKTLRVICSRGMPEKLIKRLNGQKVGESISGKTAQTGQSLIVDDVVHFDGVYEETKESGFKSIITIPIMFKDTFLGVIGLSAKKEYRFSKDDRDFLEYIGREIAIAVQNARFFEESSLRGKWEETFGRIAATISRSINTDEIFNALVTELGAALDASRVCASRLEGNKGQLVIHYQSVREGSSSAAGAVVGKIGGELARTLFDKKQMLVTLSVEEEPLLASFKASLEEFGVKSMITSPIFFRERLLGVILVQECRYGRRWSDYEVNLVERLASHAAFVLENARLFRMITRMNKRLAQLYELSFSMEGTLQQIFSHACESVAAALEADYAFVEKIENDSVYRFASNKRAQELPDGKMPFKGSLAESAVKARKPVVKNGLDWRFRRQGAVRKNRFRSLISFPLVEETGRINYVLNVVSLENDHFSQDDLNPLYILAQRLILEMAKAERHQREKELQAQLVQAQKMESVGRLAGGIAHDFNNLLGGILGYASFMKSRMRDGNPLYKYVSVIESAAERAAELTMQLLSFSRGGKYQAEVININGSVEEAVKLLRRSIGKEVEILTDLAGDIRGVEADETQMVQMLLNLCINAKDAMPEGGRITIRTRNTEVDKTYARTHVGLAPGRYVSVSVRDEGMGMDDETLKKIFEPFFTTKDEGKGTGLGLAMVYGIVKNHGGDISVRSRKGQGSVFEVLLPATTRPAHGAPERDARAVKGSETVLVVDDEQIIREFLKDTLEELGYRVMLAKDGPSAIELFSRHHNEVDLIILDMVMPRMRGIDVFKGLKEIDPKVKVILSSGYSRSGEARAILREGVLDFVQKPFTEKKLSRVVRNALDMKV